MQQALKTEDITRKLADLCRKLGRLPTRIEIKFERRVDPTFPSHSTVGNKFPTNTDLVSAMRELGSSEEYKDLLRILPAPAPSLPRTTPLKDGMVYLLRSGANYKIGRSDDVERRVKEISVALPDKIELVHTIRTDDPVGIETYWHRRFSDRRANGEWFRLSADDLKAFRRRTFQ